MTFVSVCAVGDCVISMLCMQSNVLVEVAWIAESSKTMTTFQRFKT